MVASHAPAVIDQHPADPAIAVACYRWPAPRLIKSAILFQIDPIRINLSDDGHALRAQFRGDSGIASGKFLGADAEFTFEISGRRMAVEGRDGSRTGITPEVVQEIFG